MRLELLWCGQCSNESWRNFKNGTSKNGSSRNVEANIEACLVHGATDVSISSGYVFMLAVSHGIYS